MKRSRLKNIINKSKGLSNKPIVGEPFDEFKKSLPMEVDDNYRLEAAWKAYGSPKDYREALWQGLIQPIDENTFKLPSIGYNEETDEYEYLNKGKENETVDKDIRVWDNDVIPLVKELKLGGYLRVYNEEKECWTYSKNKPSEDMEYFKLGGKKKIKIKTEDGGFIEVDSLDEDQRAGRKSIGKYKGIDLYMKGDGTCGPSHVGKQNPETFKQGGSILQNVIPEGALHCRKNGMEDLGLNITPKGIPVIDNDGNLQAEIEKNEIIYSKSTTDTIEKAYKEFYQENTSEIRKNELAIKIGKFLTKEIIENTQDNTGLIQEVANKQ